MARTRLRRVAGHTGVMPEKREITTHDSTVDEWTRALAESSGSPGGGAGAGVMLAIAASLTSMAAGYTHTTADLEVPVQQVIDRARALRSVALELADDDAAASKAFGAAFRLAEGQEREDAIAAASVEAARASAELGRHALAAIDDLAWLADNGNPALIADVVVAFGALRSAVSGARTNVSFDLSSVEGSGVSRDDVRAQHPHLTGSISDFDRAIDRIDEIVRAINGRGPLSDLA